MENYYGNDHLLRRRPDGHDIPVARQANGIHKAIREGLEASATQDCGHGDKDLCHGLILGYSLVAPLGLRTVPE